MPRPKAGADLVGRAFRGPDGIVRWVHAQSTRGLLHLRWLDELSNTWFAGGGLNPKDAPATLCEEVPLAPKMGDTFMLCGPLGTRTKYRVTEGSILQIA